MFRSPLDERNGAMANFTCTLAKVPDVFVEFLDFRQAASPNTDLGGVQIEFSLQRLGGILNLFD